VIVPVDRCAQRRPAGDEVLQNAGMAETGSTDVLPPAAPQYRSLQALRALAAVLVVLHHTGGPDGFEAKVGGDPRLFAWAYPGGALGVDLFFVISGFIMLVTTDRIPRGWRSGREFLLRRISRVYPAYLVLTALVFVLYLVRPGLVNSSQETPPDVLASFLLLPQEGLPLLLVGWTLVYEMYFYLVFAASLLAPRRLLVPLLAAWGLLTVVLHGLVTPVSDPYLRLAGNLQNLEFLLGVAVALVVTRRPVPPAALFLVPATVLLVVVGTQLARTGRPPEGWLHLVGVGGGCALLLAGVVSAELRNGWRTPQPLVALGDASYSLYLVHVPALKAVALVAVAVLPTGRVAHVVAVAAALLLTLAGAAVYHVLVERPLSRWARRALLGRRVAARALAG
jgi:exopolysaccharide production protein ExoZ